MPKYSKKDTGGLGKLLALILFQLFFTLFIGLVFNHLILGGNLRELFVITGDSFKDIEWKYMTAFILGMILFYFLMKH